ncbi:MAG: galactokinase [Cyclobacteriaceae bacterium]|nr:galactokinase [Cyclobacteriaceae bacterium]UYN87720.1 MAG: galactokinase [Cyclobacteriaceae bacterium]
MVESLRKVFSGRYTGEPLIVRSPGRINLIGEHTDYNNGFVLPAAIDKAVYVAIGKNNSEVVRLFASAYNDFVETPLSAIVPAAKKTWTNYILGVVDQFQKRGYHVRGFDLAITGDVPLGAGLSSSAAVECAVAFALNEIFDFRLNRLDLVKLAQKAEHEFAGVMCGIMDQFASVFGKKDHVIKLDCRSLDFEYVPLKLKGYKLLLVDSQVKHSLASSAYNKRREECQMSVELIRKKYPIVLSLRDATPEMLYECIKPIDDILFKRASFVVNEIMRVPLACNDLTENNIQAFGQKMFTTHEGLSTQYEVSCRELDFLVDRVKVIPSVLGARMMGGGFGGCTLNIVEESTVDDLIDFLAQQYYEAFSINLKTYPVNLEEGTGIVGSSLV